MLKKISPILIGLLLIGAGCTTTDKTNKITINETTLRQEIETSYNNLVKAIDEDNMEGFFKISPPPDPNIKLTKKDWDDAKSLLKKEFKPLSESSFLEVYYQEPKAYYFHKTYLSDPNYDTVDVMVWEKVDNNWTYAAGGGSYSAPKKEANNTINQWIKDFKSKLNWKKIEPKKFSGLSFNTPPDIKLEEKETEVTVRKDANNYLRITKRKSLDERMAELDKEMEDFFNEENEDVGPEKIEPARTLNTNNYEIELFYDEKGKELIELIADTIGESIPRLDE